MVSNSSTNESAQTPVAQDVPSDNWDSLAALTGFVPEPAGTTAKLPTDDLLDPADLEEANALDANHRPVWTNPFAKGGLVSLLMAMAVGVVGLFLWSVNGNVGHRLAAKPDASSSEGSSTAVDPQQQEISRLKAINAVQTQQRLLEQSQNQNGQIVPHGQTPAKTTGSTPSRSTTAARSAPVPTVATPPSYTSPQRSSFSPERSFAGRTVPRSAPSVPQIDPQQAWQMAQSMGSYGQMTIPAPQPAAPPMVQAVSNPPASDPAQTVTEVRSTSVPAMPAPTDAAYSADINALMTGIPVHTVSLASGATVAATLATPIVWAQDLKPEDQPQRFKVTLDQPVSASDGSIALPQGTQMIARVAQVSESGLLELTVEKVIVADTAGDRAVDVPPGSILIGGENGNPLVARNYNHHGNPQLGQAIEAALFGGLAQVGQLLNRPSNEMTTTTPYLSSTNVTNGNTNVVGGILQGAFGALSQQLQQEQQAQQQQAQNVMRRPSLWYVEAGQHLQVFVNSSIQL